MKHFNPSNGEISEFPETRYEEISSLFNRTKEAQPAWAVKSVAERVATLRSHGKLIEKRRTDLRTAITEDMGKPIDKSEIEVTRCIDAVDYFLNNAENWLAPEPRNGGTIYYDPLGVSAAITPWNAPLVAPMFQLIPSLLAGNTVLWKPSEFAPRISKLYSDLLAELLPGNVVNIVSGGKEHGKKLLECEFQFLSFTGSTATGRSINEKVSSSFTRVQLEMGGVDAAIILKDVDVRKVARSVVQINASNSGQICCSIKRVFVEKEIAEDFMVHAAQASREIKVGNPYKNPDMGPLVSQAQLEKCESFLADAKSKGGQLLSGGNRIGEKGYYFEHTVVTGLQSDSMLLCEEAFGPILPIVEVETAEEGIERANALPYGLTASVWGMDNHRMTQIASKLRAGVIGLNRHGVPPLGCPWGGVGYSGMGRGRSIEGIRENCNIKFVQ